MAWWLKALAEIRLPEPSKKARRDHMSATPTPWRSGQKNRGLTYASLGPGTTNEKSVSRKYG